MSAAIRILKEGRVLETLDIREPMSLGRGEGCIIRLEDHAVSRKHALLTPTDQQGVLKFEKKSEFGWIRHNGQEKGQGLAAPGDVLEVGPFQLEVIDATSALLQAAPVDPLNPSEPTPAPLSISEELETPSPLLDPIPQMESGAVSLEQQEAPLDLPLADEAPMPESTEAVGDFMTEPSQEESSPLAGLALESPTAAPSDRTQVIDTDGATRLTPLGRIQGRLVFAAGAAAVDQFDLSQGPDRLVIGRGRSSDIQLQDKKSSRAHIEILRREGKYHLKDLGSANGTFVNGEKLTAESEVELQSGDRIQVGDAQFAYEVVSQDYLEREQSFLPVEAHQAGVSDIGSLGDSPLVDGGAWTPAQDAYGAPIPDFGLDQNGVTSLGDLNAASQAEGLSAPVEEKGLKGIIAKYKAIPRQKRMTLLLILAAVVYMGWMGQDEEESSKKAKKKPKPQASISGLPVSLTFDDLSKEMQQKVLQGREDATRHYTGGEFEEALLKAESVLSILNNDEVAIQIKRYSQIAIQKKKQIEEENARKRQAEERLEKIQAMVAEIESKMQDARKGPDNPTKFDAVADLLANTELRVLDPENTQIKKWETEIGEYRQKVLDVENSRSQLGDLRRDFEESFAQAKKGVVRALDETDAQQRLKNLAVALKLLSDIRLKEGFASDEASRGKGSDPKMMADLKAIAKVIAGASKEAERCRLAIDETLAPQLSAASEAESAKDHVKAFDLWQKVAVLDDLRVLAFAADGQELVSDAAKNRGRAGMERIRGVLNAQAKSIYTEGVLAESYSDFAKARQKFQELLERAPKDDSSVDSYYSRARRKLALYEQFDQANASGTGTAVSSEGTTSATSEERTPASEASADEPSSMSDSPTDAARVPVYDPTGGNGTSGGP